MSTNCVSFGLAAEALKTYTKTGVATMTEQWIDPKDTTIDDEETACILCSPVAQVPTLANLANFTALDYAGMISTTVNFNPLIVGIVENEFNVELPLEVSVNRDFQGNFSVPSDLAELPTGDISDGDITIDFPLISQVFGISPDTPVLDLLSDFGITVPNSVLEILDALDITDANSAIEVVDNLFDLELTGSGTLTSEAGTTGLNFNYLGEQNTFVIDGFDPTVVEGSLVGPSTITAEGDFSVDLVLSEFVNVTNLLEIDLPSNVDSFLAWAQLFNINQIEVASGSFSLDATTVPVSAPLASYTDLVSAAGEPTLYPVAVSV